MPSSSAPTSTEGAGGRTHDRRLGARRLLLLRHRHTGDPEQACKRETATISRRDTVPLFDIYLLLHRRPDVAAGSKTAFGARRAERRSSAASTSQSLSADVRRDGAGISAISAPIAQTGSRRSSGCCWSLRAGGRIAASSWRGRCIPQPSTGRPMSSGSSIMRARAHHAGFYNAQALDTEYHARGHGCGRLQPERAPVRGNGLRRAPIISDPWAGPGDDLPPRTQEIVIASGSADDVVAALSMPDAERGTLAEPRGAPAASHRPYRRPSGSRTGRRRSASVPRRACRALPLESPRRSQAMTTRILRDGTGRRRRRLRRLASLRIARRGRLSRGLHGQSADQHDGQSRRLAARAPLQLHQA